MNVLSKAFKNKISDPAISEQALAGASSTAQQYCRTVYPMSIAGTGAAVPSREVKTSDLDPATQECGVGRRFQSDQETTIELAAQACRQALRETDMVPGSIDCLIFCGALAYQAIPSTAVFVQKALGLENTNIPAFDVNASCLGFLTAMDVAGALISAGRYQKILVCAADAPSKATGWQNATVQAMFGDGAAAALVTRSRKEDAGVLAISLETHTEGATACQMRAFGTNLNPHDDLNAFLDGTRFEMDGRMAYEVASRYMPKFMNRLLDQAGIRMQNIDLVVPHQASAYAIQRMRRRLGLPHHKVFDIFAQYGNQVAASLPTALHEARSRGLIKTGSTILLLGTGAGITIGGAILRI